MKQHTYKITLTHELDQHDHPVSPEQTLTFQAKNHDDILSVVARMKQSGHFDDEQTATQFAVGLKLFSEVMLENRNHPLFQDFSEHFGVFMKQLKRGK